MTLGAHIFVDNSNVIAGAQDAARLRENAPWPAVRIHWRNFFRVAEGNYRPLTRVFAGSLPPGNDALWKYARDNGYDTSLLKRVASDDGKIREQAVDEVMHAKIAGALLDFDAPQVLVLVTGDGQDGEFGTSFIKQATRAIRRGWDVDVISWDGLLSDNYRRLEREYPDRIQIVKLDDFYSSITFLCQGDFHHGDGVMIHVQERVTSHLPTDFGQ